jgi:hypothetical protein
MSGNEQREQEWPRIFELFCKFLEEAIKLLKELVEWFKHKNHRPVRAEGKLDNMNNAKLITFTEFDSNGKVVPIDPTVKPITFASDNPAVATIDSTQQTANKGVMLPDGVTPDPSRPDGSVSCPVVSLVNGPGGNANITGVDPANLGPDGKPLAAGDVDTVLAVVGVPVKATAVLS